MSLLAATVTQTATCYRGFRKIFTGFYHFQTAHFVSKNKIWEDLDSTFLISHVTSTELLKGFQRILVLTVHGQTSLYNQILLPIDQL